MVLSTRFRLITLLSTILLIAFVSISVINYRTTRSSLRNEIVSSSLPLLRENIYSEIQNDFIPLLNHASLMANNSFLKQWSEAGEARTGEVTRFLLDIREKYDYFSTFFVSAKTGNYYHYSGILKRIDRADSHDSWYYDFIDSGMEYDLDVDTNEADDNLLTIFVNFRLEDGEGELLGVTGVGIKMDKFSAVLKEKQERYERTVWLVDEQGFIQAHPDGSRIHTNILSDPSGIGGIAAAILTRSSLPVNAEYSSEGGRVLITSRYMPELNWFLVVEQEETAALFLARRTLFRTILIGLAASLLIITLTVLIINHYQARLEQMASTDELTGSSNRRELNAHLDRQISRFQRHGAALSIILLDVDHFKEINDARGHLEGDRILKDISRTINGCIRPVDHLSRWGGDEFVLILECGLQAALVTAERLKTALGEKGVKVSMGVTEYLPDETTDSLFARADKALYTSKERGRDRISVL